MVDKEGSTSSSFPKSVEAIDKGLKAAFSKIRKEFDGHLETINENTNEINSNYEYLCEIDSKIQKLSERIDELQMMFMQQKPKQRQLAAPLTTREKEIFLSLYASEQSLTFKDVSRKTGLGEEMVEAYVESIIAKGVPVILSSSESGKTLTLERDFKVLQAKENIIQLKEPLVQRSIF